MYIAETEIEEHQDCMLWASKRTYKWLMSQKNNAEQQVVEQYPKWLS